jgi:thiamine-phosphate pyrophosphorylase
VSGPRLLIITDLHVADEATTCLRLGRALLGVAPGTVAVGVRDHDASIARRVAFARRLLPIVRAHGARLVVHDRVDLALAIGADGVQLGRRSIGARDARRLLGDQAWIGRSCHDEGELLRAAAEGVDAVTLSPLFASPGKGVPLGPARFRELRAKVPSMSVFALGGVDAASAFAAREAGADGVAVIRAVLCAPDPAEAVRRLLAPFQQQ